MGRLATVSAAALLALSSISSVVADAAIPTCGPGSPCPASAPCCSQYGQCGAGAYCLGGCNPLYSHTLKSCVPPATCKSENYNLNSLNDVESINKYLGGYSNVNWVASGSPAAYNKGGKSGILLTMGQGTVGTLLTSTHYVWYGKICATMTTSQGAGVVTAFIMMSSVKDEIDFEFIGVDINHAQSNFYSQGVTNYNNEVNLTVKGDTVSEAHKYCIDWKPDTLSWYIDDSPEPLRTLNRKDTWNSTSNRFDYPQTPSAVMLSLWPAGLPSNGKGTIDWAGGEISWNSPYMSDGYYYALVNEVTVECYDPPAGVVTSGSKSYVYAAGAGTNNTVEITDDYVVLKSLYASGDNPKYCPDCPSPSSKGSSSKTKSSSKSATPSVQTVPGEVGTGGRAGDQTASDSSSSSGGDGTSSSASGSSPSASAASGAGDFAQGDGSSGSGSDGSSSASTFRGSELGGSALAVVVALAAMLIL